MQTTKRFLPLTASWLILLALPLFSQTALVSRNYFPAALEFKELQSIRADREIEDAAELAALAHGPVLVEAGLQRYQERTYDLPAGGTLSVEVMTLADSRGAYSLLTLLGGPAPVQGPPGDFQVADKDGLTLAAGNCWIRVRSTEPGDLARRVAVSMAHRVERTAPKPPNLVNHLQEVGADPASVRYFLGPKAMAAFGTPLAGGLPLPIPAGVEAAQARCSAGSQQGTGTILGFPSIELAEDYFNAESGPLQKISGGPSLYTRQTGPLVAILDGNFSPQVADKTLGSLRFEYSIKWIFDRNSQGRTLWGVPVKILGTVVRSLMFTALLCLFSVLVGIMIAGARVYYRRRWGHPDDNGFIRLKINEN